MSILAMSFVALLLLITGFVIGTVFTLYITDLVNKRALQNECDTNPEKLGLPIYSWEPDDLGVYRTVWEAETHFEPWIVEYSLEFFDGAGRILRVEPVNKTHTVRLYVDDSKPPEPERLAQIIRDYVVRVKGIHLPNEMPLSDLNAYVILNKLYSW